MTTVDSPVAATSPVLANFSGPSSRSRSSTKLADDVMSLTSFNPFSEEDENDQSSYTLVTSLFSRVRNTLSAPLSSAVAAASTSNPASSANAGGISNAPDQRRPSYATQATQSSGISTKMPGSERPQTLTAAPAQVAPPLVSLTPAQPEVPTYSLEPDRSPSRNGSFYSPALESWDGMPFGTSIPGFPIHDDARSIRTTASLHRSGSVSKVIRRLRGEGLSRDYWMDDENCKECYDCKSIFTTWRRKHHCRICGQIFCSRCASNIIKGTRFGHDGRIRVCNLCLAKLANVDDDDEEDRRSVVSSAISFPAHQLGLDGFGTLGGHPQSPFAASQLFGKSGESFNLYSIAETRRRFSGSEDNRFLSRPVTPHFREREDGVWEPLHESPVPFRRALSDDEKYPASLPNTFHADDSPTAPGSETPIDIPINTAANAGGMTSSIQFPVGSPGDMTESPRPHSRLRSRFNSHGGDFEVATPFIRSRVQSRLDSLPIGEPGWRTRRESTAYAQELNLASMQHLRIMLRQMLTCEQIPNLRIWEETLLKLALRIARELTFTTFPHRQGEDMDVRRYVKIKKLPGGIPRDSEYVDGAVITKNVAHKQMSRYQRNPRVMLITFPLEFHRIEGQYMHFGQILRQEKEYLGNLATRIAGLRPHIVLVQESVSRIALEALSAHNIAVARTVKPSAIRTVARMTQGDIFSSMDKLALEPRLGHCAKYRILTYDHPLIPRRRKTLMRFEGCSRDMGCTIILRGADIDTLRRIKKVTRFLTFIVRHLKLETHLWKDSVITLPLLSAEAIPPPSIPGNVLTIIGNMIPSSSVASKRPTSAKSSDAGVASEEVASEDDDLPSEDVEQRRLSRRIDQSLEPYVKTFISVSATLRFPPPYPIRRMKELDNDLNAAKRAWEDEIVRREEHTSILHQEELTLTPTPPPLEPSLDRLEADQCNRNDPLTEAPRSHSLTPPGHTPTPENDSTTNSSLLSTSSILGNVNAKTGTGETREILKTSQDIALESKFSFLAWKHEEQKRIWEWYLRKNKDDFVVEKYQCISLWEYTIPTSAFGLQRACFAPSLTYITFYGENDCTLGQYIERSVTDTLIQFLDPKAICTGKGCDQPLARHCKVYVHHESSVLVAVEQWDGQIIGSPNYLASPDLITTWSVCRICDSATPFIPVSEEMQRYSFAKFLELHFYPADVKLVQGAGCQHNIYQHHIRYFASKGMTVRFQADPITLHEIVYPPFRIRVTPETKLYLKNSDFDLLHQRNLMWYTGLIDDLKLISIDAATGDEKEDARLLADINTLIMRAEAEKEEISEFINKMYKESDPTDTFALNKAHSYRQDKLVAWQHDFDRLPKPRPYQVTEKNGKRVSAFGSVRGTWPPRYDLTGMLDHPQFPSSTVSETEEGPSSIRPIPGESFVSSASEASEPEINAEAAKAAVPQEEVQISSEQKIETIPAPLPDHDIEQQVKTDHESDSTIGANREPSPRPISTEEIKIAEEDIVRQRASRLPRRTVKQPSVAELVQKYQEFLPAQGVHDLTKTALAPRPPVSESEQEYNLPIRRRVPSRGRNRSRLNKKASVSDFEQGYAANIAPKYLTRSKKNAVSASGIRASIPSGSILQSQESSRRPSPEKHPKARGKEVKFSRPSSPTSPRPFNVARPGRPRAPSRHVAKEGTVPRPPSAFRRPIPGAGSKVSSTVRHFERLTRDIERSKIRYPVIRGKRARPVASAGAKVKVLESIKDAIKDDSESSNSLSEADDEDEENEEEKPAQEVDQEPLPTPDLTSPDIPVTAVTAPPLVSFPDVPDVADATRESELPSTGPVSLPPSPVISSLKTPQEIPLTPPISDLELPGANLERVSLIKAFAEFWSQPSRNLLDDDVMSDPEHIFSDSSMIVRIDEPTSIIALALNSPQYREMMARSRSEKRAVREAKLNDSGEVFMPDDQSVAESTSTWGVVNLDAIGSLDPTEDLKVPSSKLPWVISFESGGLTISCTVLYPEQFDALRRTYDCEKSMIESLARCVKWNASGGKSGSAFLKTRDDRFIAKELSKSELQTMETFAPAYFDYMSSALSANRPTLLAKIFGCYKLIFKKTGRSKKSGKTKMTQMNLLVMENIFYDRRFTRIYDLKGSTRNRHVQSTGRENEVLLDENLVQTAHLNPFYVREHSKRILRGALYNDSKFLADINVMDYSLICGVDSTNNELVVGIVDYIRTYTWDKKLESWVKDSTFLGGKGDPTIVSPKQYRQRFISAMERYFPLIPDRWMKQKDTPEEDTNVLHELWPDW